ncbi:MAG: hypothetical protein JNL80_17285 [Phycisphaerae bacterium]|jgi:hypothetical protein|nr:hypothetical protein [Phycisphaerae bacterium]
MNEHDDDISTGTLTPDHERMLARGLGEFDRSTARRRTRRRVVRGTAAAVLVVALALIAARFGTQPNDSTERNVAMGKRSLPAYVELINDDLQLTVELELARACERIGRRGGEVYVVECARR